MEQVIHPLAPTGTRGPTVPVLELAGEIDLAVAPSLHEQLEHLHSTGAISLVVDLSDATFIDSTALGVLVNALNQCQGRGGQLHLIVTEPQILRVLRITGLNDTFSVHQSRDEVESNRGDG